VAYPQAAVSQAAKSIVAFRKFGSSCWRSRVTHMVRELLLDSESHRAGVLVDGAHETVRRLTPLSLHWRTVLPLLFTWIPVGSLASYGRLRLVPSLIAALTACLLADGFWYRVGRQGWSETHRLCRTNSKWQGRALRLIRGHSAATLLLAKFVAGSNLASLLAGKAGVSTARFLTCESIGSLTWSGTYIAVGYLFHGRPHWTLAQTLRPLLVARVAVFLARWWRRRSLAYAAVLALAIVFFCPVRPVNQYNAGLRVATALTPHNRRTKVAGF
jgi:membrane protein DedA with SNARE-associated domain